MAKLIKGSSLLDKKNAAIVPVYHKTINSPWGTFTAVASDKALYRFDFDPEGSETDESPIIDLLETQLNEFFVGLRTKFELPLQYPVKSTPFQQRVWNTLLTIPAGEAITYQKLAEKVGCLKGHRAVAQGCAKNPFSIIVPCHRIITSNGKLGGYFWGLELKAKLLTFELGAYASKSKGVQIGTFH